MSLNRRWVDRAAELVRAVISGMPEQGSEFRLLTKVQPDQDLGKGWYVLLARVSPNQIDGIGEGLLRHGSGSSALAYDVLEVAVEADRVRVRASITAPGGQLDLLVPRMNQRNILSGLADGLSAVRENRLLDAFSRPGLDRIQDLTDTSRLHGWAGLRPAQRRGVAACCSSGLQLIWGSGHRENPCHRHGYQPSRGVGPSSAARVVDQHRRRHGSARGRPDHATTVRVGGTRRSGVVAVAPERLPGEHRPRRGGAAVPVAPTTGGSSGEARRTGPSGDRLTRAEARLAGFDRSGYEAALRRLGNAADLDRAHSTLRATRSEFEGAQASSSRARTVGLAVAWREAADRLSSAQASLGSVDDELTLLGSQSWLKRRRGVARLQAARTDLVAELARLAQNYEKRRTPPRRSGQPWSMLVSSIASGPDNRCRPPTRA